MIEPRSRSLVLLGIALAILTSARAEQAAPDGHRSTPPRTVLVIHWGSEEYPTNAPEDAAIREALVSGSDEPVNYYTEFLESELIPGDEPVLALRDYIEHKYRGQRIDVVVAVTSVSLQFVLRFRQELFPDAPVVYRGTVAADEDLRRAGAGLTGVVLGGGLKENLECALALHPGTERVFVVARWPNRPTDALLAELDAFAPRVALEYITQGSVAALIDRVKTAQTRSLVLFVRHSQENPERVLLPYEVARMVAQAAPVPVYGPGDVYMGTGIVGGYVVPSAALGRRLGEMTRQILDGRRAQDIPIEEAARVPTFDSRQLRRWGIAESALPAGSTVLFREDSFWERYFWPIVGSILLIVAQGAIISVLLVQRRQRRRVEVALRLSEEKARASYDEVRELAGRLISARESERTRIARDLHDDIGQRVASLSIALSRVQREVPDTTSPARQSLSALEQQTVQLSADLRHLSHELHPGALEHLGLLRRCANDATTSARKAASPYASMSPTVGGKWRAHRPCAYIAWRRKPCATSRRTRAHRTSRFRSSNSMAIARCSSPMMAADSIRRPRRVDRDWVWSACVSGCTCSAAISSSRPLHTPVLALSSACPLESHMRPKVLLADDHAIVAEGLARLIGEVADLVGQVNDGVRLVEDVRRLRPDIVVADVTMPGMSGIDAMRLLKAEGSDARFIFLTIHTEARLAAEAMRSGASGYLLKQAAGNELFDAIQAVMSGRTYLTPLITGDVLRKLTSPTDAAERELTPRQREVLRLLAQGKRMKEIAAELDISVRTVENHKAHLLQVLSLGSTADLVRFAIKQHIVPE